MRYSARKCDALQWPSLGAILHNWATARVERNLYVPGANLLANDASSCHRVVVGFLLPWNLVFLGLCGRLFVHLFLFTKMFGFFSDSVVCRHDAGPVTFCVYWSSARV